MEAGIIVLFSILLRWLVGMHSYSGKNKPPLYGDYEAQRHWQEVTVNLPVREWYRNGTDNDLLYWGLDYPPLTAYHSYIIGKIARLINPAWVELHTSRGLESYEHKVFMRSTVLVTDILLYLSALYFIWRRKKLDSKELLRVMIVPSIMLIDYGHFQYNTVSLGLLLWSCLCFQSNNIHTASFLFCLSLNYKQISLYYSLPIFFYILKHCYDQKSIVNKLLRLLTIAVIVCSTFAVLWLPYLTSLHSVLQVVRRIFPVERGIYEDKVANFWFCLSVFIKIKNILPLSSLTLLSTLTTLVCSLPSCYFVYRRNTFLMLKYSLSIVSLCFFLFSFQVHEKSILFVNVPLLLLSEEHPLLVVWFSLISTFSLEPLLGKDDLLLASVAVTAIYVIVSADVLASVNKSHSLVLHLSLLGCLALYCLPFLVPPPPKWPHLYIVFNCLYSFLHFVSFFVYLNYRQLCLYRRECDKKEL